MKNNTTKKFDIYEMITERVIAQMEKGQIPWKQPWFNVNDGAFSRATGKCYSLLNQCILGNNHEYVTWDDVKKEKGKVKKGAHQKQIVFWTTLTKTEKDKDGNEKEITFPFLKYYNVFDIEDTDLKPTERKVGKAEDNAKAEDIVKDYLNRSGVKLTRTRNSNEAFYSPITDKITIPCKKQFDLTSEYYSTLFHEMTHSTGHKSRLNRISDTASFGNEEYSKEELVAELGAASLVNYCGIEMPKSFKNSVAYLQSWLKALKNDKKLIVKATGQAQKAMNLILNITTEKSKSDKQSTKPSKQPTSSVTEKPTKTGKIEQPKKPEKIEKVASKADMKKRIKDGQRLYVKYTKNPTWKEIVGVERAITYGQSNAVMVQTSWLLYNDIDVKDGKLTYKANKDVQADVYAKVA